MRDIRGGERGAIYIMEYASNTATALGGDKNLSPKKHKNREHNKRYIRDIYINIFEYASNIATAPNGDKQI